MATVLVTGINGFVGHHVARALKTENHSIVGIGAEEILSPKLNNVVESYISCDLSDPEAVTGVDLKGIDALIHLAGLANVGQSFSEPAKFISINAAITVNVLENLLVANPAARCVIVSSGALYDSNQAMPISEAGKIAHNSPYVVSKLATENLAEYYTGRGLNCVTVRPFNHIGPGQGPGFLLPDLAEKLSARAGGEAIAVGNLETKRDYTDVRDVAQAYALLATGEKLPEHAIYNVCSGVSHTGKEILEALASAIAIQVPETVVDQKFMRPNDVMDIRGDNTRLSREFNWQPKYSLEQTVKDFVVARKTTA